jgi:hypothetical protein
MGDALSLMAAFAVSICALAAMMFISAYWFGRLLFWAKRRWKL